MSSKPSRLGLRTLTFRLMAWHVAAFTVLCAVLLYAFLVAGASALRRHTDKSLLDESLEVRVLYEREDIEALKREFSLEAETEGIQSLFFALLETNGTLLASSELAPWRHAPLTPPEPMGAADAPILRTVPGPSGGHPVRMVWRRTGDGRTIINGRSLEGDERLIAIYRSIVAGAILAAFLGSGLLAWSITRRAMAGVQQVTDAAVRIGAADLSLRVPVGGGGEEIDNLARAFNGMLERIDGLVAELRDVTGNVAHDLRSPLTRIRGMAETTLTNPSGLDEYRDMAGMVIEECDRLVSMVNTMLDLAEIDAGTVAFNRAPVDLSRMTREAADLFGPVAEDKGIRLSVEAPGGPLWTRGAEGRLQRALANLLDNAIKYTRAGGTITVRTEQAGEDIRIAVADSGPGIPAGELPRIFDRFYRGDRSRSTPGNGLGLCLARAIVRAHGGDIRVESLVDRGSTFTMVLPSPAAQGLAQTP